MSLVRFIWTSAGVPTYELHATSDGGYVAVFDAIDPQTSALGVQASKLFVN
jgi:hypothetical protein